jgi:hypothetical protein
MRKGKDPDMDPEPDTGLYLRLIHIQETQKYADPADLDPQHWNLYRESAHRFCS